MMMKTVNEVDMSVKLTPRKKLFVEAAAEMFGNGSTGFNRVHVEPGSNTIEPGGKKMCLFTSAEPPEVAQLSPYKARKARS